MSTTNNKASIEEFLSVMIGSREVGLVIAKNEAEILSFVKAMNRFDFKRLDSVLEYQNTDYGQYVIIENKDKFKEIYDFVCQYPLTVISLFDSVNSKTISFKPDYKNPVVVLATDEILKDFQKIGFDLFGRVGPTYRSK